MKKTHLKILLLIALFVTLCELNAFCECKPVPGHIMTEWVEKIDPNCPLPEYQRRQLVRDNWINLNGLWDYAIRPLTELYIMSLNCTK